jgi:L-alanine-DL-glutamate epimerase-like enolase superfamily enzyme
MPIIESVQVASVAVPLDKVTSFSTRTVSERHYCLVKVRGKDGHEGIGFCYVGSAGGDIAKLAVEQLLAPKLIGQNSHRSEGLWMDMYNESILQGRAGAVMRGISILDTALWDLNARVAGLPLHHYLGSVVDDRVPAYASGGYYLDGKTPAKLGKEMESYVKQGFKAVKMKVGRLSPAEEEARVKAARKAIGEDILLTLDANNAWRDLPTALEYVRRFEAYNPYWIEEPFSPDAIDLHAALARQTTINVVTGEMEAGRWRFRELIDAGGAAILQSDAAVCGGITEWRRISAYADAKGITVCPHWMHDLHAPLVAATPNARFVEFFLDDQVLNFRRLINKQLTFKNGDLILHKTPGLGFEFDEAAIKKYAGKEAWRKISK